MAAWTVIYRLNYFDTSDVVMEFGRWPEAVAHFETVKNFAGLKFAKLVEPSGTVRAYVRPEEKKQ